MSYKWFTCGRLPAGHQAQQMAKASAHVLHSSRDVRSGGVQPPVTATPKGLCQPKHNFFLQEVLAESCACGWLFALGCALLAWTGRERAREREREVALYVLVPKAVCLPSAAQPPSGLMHNALKQGSQHTAADWQQGQ